MTGDILQLEYIYDIKLMDKYLDRYSVNIAPFESKSKEVWEWKATIQAGMLVDAHDKSVWNKSTILEIKEEQIAPGRVVKLALIAYRVYQEKGTKSDEKGNYEGWSCKFDEWIAVYSPRLAPFFSKTQKGISDDLDLDEDLDNLLTPEEGHTRLYAVPRVRICISYVFLHLVNTFGHIGGFDQVLQLLAKNESTPQNEEQKSEGGAAEANGGVSLNMLASVI